LPNFDQRPITLHPGQYFQNECSFSFFYRDDGVEVFSQLHRIAMAFILKIGEIHFLFVKK
jgi:hypothetical protein